MIEQEKFEKFVSEELGDIAVKDNGRYISPKIQTYWRIWEGKKESVQEPVAWVPALHPGHYITLTKPPESWGMVSLCLCTPPVAQQQWVGLTEKEYVDVTAQHFGKNGVSWFEDSLPSFVKDIEAKLKEKNS
jgi:hypothetical protein